MESSSIHSMSFFQMFPPLISEAISLSHLWRRRLGRRRPRRWRRQRRGHAPGVAGVAGVALELQTEAFFT